MCNSLCNGNTASSAVPAAWTSTSTHQIAQCSRAMQRFIVHVHKHGQWSIKTMKQTLIKTVWKIDFCRRGAKYFASARTRRWLWGGRRGQMAAWAKMHHRIECRCRLEGGPLHLTCSHSFPSSHPERGRSNSRLSPAFLHLPGLSSLLLGAPPKASQGPGGLILAASPGPNPRPWKCLHGSSWR